MTTLNDVVWETLKKNLERLTWKCTLCPKIEECEEKEQNTSRYCVSLIKAAVYEKVGFKQPFEPKDEQ